MNHTEIDRLAAMAHAMRPDWPVGSVRTLLATSHAHRPYRDCAVALAWIAADPETSTPKRLEFAGPWWRAAVVDEPTPTPTPPKLGRDPVIPASPDHIVELAQQVRTALRAAREASKTVATGAPDA